MYISISSDWEGLEYSEKFLKEYLKKAKQWIRENRDNLPDPKKDLYLDYETSIQLEEARLGNGILLPGGVSEEIKAGLLREMQEESFAELVAGAIVFEYDETKVHPVKTSEEYGGTDIRFEDDPLGEYGPETEHAMTYDPTGQRFCDTGKEGSGYDPRTDSYSGSVAYGGSVSEYRIKGSKEAAEEIVSALPEEEQEPFRQYMKYPSASLGGIRDMMELKPEQRQVYIDIWSRYDHRVMTHDKLMRYAKIFDKRILEGIYELKLAAACNPWRNHPITPRQAWLCCEKMDYLRDFFCADDLKQAIFRTKDYSLLKYMPMLRDDREHIEMLIKDVESVTEHFLKDGKPETAERIRDTIREVDWRACLKESLLAADRRAGIGNPVYKEPERGILDICSEKEAEEEIEEDDLER